MLPLEWREWELIAGSAAESIILGENQDSLETLWVQCVHGHISSTQFLHINHCFVQPHSSLFKVLSVCTCSKALDDGSDLSGAGSGSSEAVQLFQEAVFFLHAHTQNIEQQGSIQKGTEMFLLLQGVRWWKTDLCSSFFFFWRFLHQAKLTHQAGKMTTDGVLDGLDPSLLWCW